MRVPNMKQEKETYTVFRHVVGEDHAPFTAVTSFEMKIHSEASVLDMIQAFRSFLLAIGYEEKSISKYIEADNDSIFFKRL